MAISNIKNSTALVLRFEKGQNFDGTPKIVSQKYSKINKEATDEELFTVGSAIGEVLVKYPMELKRVEDFTLMEE